MIDKTTAVILAGGKSSRMGEDKAFILFSGKPLIEILIDKLSCLFAESMIITNKPNLYEKYGIKTQKDIVKDCGALGGIYTGLYYSKNNYNFIVGCDMPFLNEDLIRFMSEERNGYDVVMPRRNGCLEPLCAIYSKHCITPIEEAISKNNLKVTAFLKHVKIRLLDENEIARFDLNGRCFANINTPKDKEELEHEGIDNLHLLRMRMRTLSHRR